MDEYLKYQCDLCGATLLTTEEVRYLVKIDVVAVYDSLELTQEDLNENIEEKIEELAEKAALLSGEEAQNSVARRFVFYLCLKCQKQFVKNPLGK